jgi:hypothetical protein
LHGGADRSLPPTDRRAEPGGHGQKPKDQREVRRVITVVATSHHETIVGCRNAFVVVMVVIHSNSPEVAKERSPAQR